MTTTFPKDVPPNDEALAIPNLIPGAEMLGYGFNIFKDYSFDASIQPLLKLGAPRSWSSSKNVTYNVPEYVTTPGGSKATALAKTFDSASEFSSYFQSSASVSGSVGAFSTSFSTAYGSERKDTYSTSWAMVEADFHQWSLRLRESNVLDSVAADPDWANLPDTFDAHNADNVLKFYQFFRRFGTHFISRVSAGGTLYYYISVQK